MKTNKNSYGIRQDIAEALAVGVKDMSDGPWKEICKKFPDVKPTEGSPCRDCRAAMHAIATWDTRKPAPKGDPIDTIKSMLGDYYEPFIRTYMVAYTKMLHASDHVPAETPAKPPVKKKPAKKKPAKKKPAKKPRAKRDNDITIELPERIRKTKTPNMVKVPLINDPVPIEDVVLSSKEEEILNQIKNPLAVGTSVEKVYDSIAVDIEEMDETRMLIIFAYLPEASATKLLNYIEKLRKAAAPIAERIEEFTEEFAEVAKKIPRSQIKELADRGWDVVTYVFAPIGVGIILNRPAMIINAMFEEFLMLFDGVAFPELTEIVCKLFVATQSEKPERIVNLSQQFLTTFTKLKETDAVRKPLYEECQKIVDRELGAIPEALEIAKYLEKALIDEET